MKTITQKLAICIVMLLGFITQSIAQSWEIVGQAGFSAGQAQTISSAFSDSNELYVAFHNGNINKVTVMKFDGNNWVTVGQEGFSEGFSRNPSLAFSPDDEPYIAFSDGANEGATVMKFDGINWVNVGSTGFSDTEVWRTSLVFSNSGEPYLAFSDMYNYQSSVMKFDGSNWVLVGQAGFTGSNEADMGSLDFSNSGEPYVVFIDDVNDWKPSVMKFDGENWVLVGQAGFSDTDDWPSLAFSNNNEPYVASSSYTSGISVKKFDGNNWISIGPSVFSMGSRISSKSLAFNTDGEPHIVFSNLASPFLYSSLTVMKFNGTNWVNVGSPAFTTSTAHDYSFNLIFNNNDEPYVAFRDYSTGHKATVMKYANAMSVDDVAFENVLLYPNPVKDILYFEKEVNNVTITDLTGKVLATQTNKNQIDMSGFQNGVYLITLETESNIKQTKKIVKQ